ncbi:DUF5407 family protein [Candidatus Similichlamydia laticola]|uniref:Uncharacterized protein n=1 Tax=Candidatus Similichlamydia laticola TaxID=2170265 RepID=A0A369KB34_9BACT|nr:DUF5407 family protein [Candidatus Similichlamydia laticola]RDB31819.1 hypothetical protein HAT2_00072 [Candidatus Similichlamydia laticola]
MATSSATPFATAYSGPESSLTTAGIFELAVHDWNVSDQNLGALPVTRLFQIIGSQGKVVTDKILSIENNGSGNLSIATMFELQLKTQRLCQMTEMGTSLTTAISGCLQSIARNTK